MLAIVVKLKSAMDTFTSNVKEIYARNQKNINIYSNEYMSKQIAAEVVDQRRKSLDIAAGLTAEFTSAVKNAKTKLYQAKYPNCSNEASRTAGELQLTHSRDLLNAKLELPAVMHELELALEIGRIDFVSAVLDNIKGSNLYPNDIRLEHFEARFNEKHGIQKPLQEYVELEQNKKLLQAFVDDLLAGGEYTPYPVVNNEVSDEEFFNNPELARKTSYYLNKMNDPNYFVSNI